MARARVFHSDDACTVIFKGNKRNPEPSTGIIKFPGGHVEVSRCTDGTYWAHISIDEGASRVGSRIDYTPEYAAIHGIPDIPDGDQVKHIAVRVDGPYVEPGA